MSSRGFQKLYVEESREINLCNDIFNTSACRLAGASLHARLCVRNTKSETFCCSEAKKMKKKRKKECSEDNELHYHVDSLAY